MDSPIPLLHSLKMSHQQHFGSLDISKLHGKHPRRCLWECRASLPGASSCRALLEFSPTHPGTGISLPNGMPSGSGIRMPQWEEGEVPGSDFCSHL